MFLVILGCYGILNTKTKINDDESVIIQSYVDAQNSFGAIIRTNFRCTVDKYGKVKDLKTW